MSENMKIYEAVRSVPTEAKKKITGGRLNGMTDINPMWRIKKLTEQFGPCGTGWYAQVERKWIEAGADSVQVAFVDVNLFYRMANGEWSAPVPGTGGSMFVAKEKNGLNTSDEAFKMAYTDAISVCCKMLGMGADVYWDADRTKYTGPQAAAEEGRAQRPAPADRQPKLVCERCGKEITGGTDANGKPYSAFAVAKKSMDRFGKKMCAFCAQEAAIRQEKKAEEERAAAFAQQSDDGEVPPWEGQ
jgi:ribosomal protein L34E